MCQLYLSSQRPNAAKCGEHNWLHGGAGQTPVPTALLAAFIERRKHQVSYL